MRTMSDLFANIAWKQKTGVVDRMLEAPGDLCFEPVAAGLEAEVYKIRFPSVNAVLKIWNKRSNPDVHFQHELLQELKLKGISVPEPYGWGLCHNSIKVLLTSDAGAPVSDIDQNQLKKIVNLLVDIHHISFQQLDQPLRRTYDFVQYFYPEIHRFPDIRNAVNRLVRKAEIKQEKLIHGDFHLGNILNDHGEIKIIDWTNAQLGDPRYDVAWASFLIKIYIGETMYSAFQNEYMKKNVIPETELVVFEALACLRWILLNRMTDIPKNERIIDRVNHAIQSNPELHRELVI